MRAAAAKGIWRKPEDDIWCPDLNFVLTLWPLYRDGRLPVNEMTLETYELMVAFQTGYDEYIERKSKLKPGVKEMGGIPGNLIQTLSRGKGKDPENQSRVRAKPDLGEHAKAIRGRRRRRKSDV